MIPNRRACSARTGAVSSSAGPRVWSSGATAVTGSGFTGPAATPQFRSHSVSCAADTA